MDKTQAIGLLNETFNNNFEILKFIKFIKELFNEIKIENCGQINEILLY